jgi:uncharacterized phage protein gp47/JayE
MSSRDRRTRVIESTRLNGIDFVEVVTAAQTLLAVHFLNAVPVTLDALPTITGGDTIQSVAVEPVMAGDWSTDGSHVTLSLHVAAPGDFSTYTLTLSSPAIDPFFATAAFSFKALCPSDNDCETPAPACSQPPGNPPPIDYTAKDFLSFRQALMDFSALRYPGWQERSEADVGVMLLEAIASVADDLSYTQDRYAAEATLTTATQRRSVIRHARLVDYEPLPAVSAQTTLQFAVATGTSKIAFGVRAVAQASDGTPIVFETGPNLAARPGSAPASPLWNPAVIKAYWFDDSTQCLQAGATSLFVKGHGYDFQPEQLVLIETATGPGEAPLRQVVRLLDASSQTQPWASELCDAVFTTAADPPGAGPPWFACITSPPSDPAPTAVTQITWGAVDALLAARDLAQTTVSGNLVAATQGWSVEDEAFAIQPAPGDTTMPAIVRVGPRSTDPDTGGPGSAVPQYLHTLAAGTVAWLPAPASAADPNPQPEIQLTQLPAGSGPSWAWMRSLLQAAPSDAAFTLEPALYRLIQRRPDGTVQFEYDGDAGDTLRFGDGSFGLLPPEETRFGVSYRVGTGASGNLPPDAIRRIDPGQPDAVGLLAVRNPLPATGGADPESLDHVRRIAPMAFRSPIQRAVIAQDYQDIATQLAWVRRASTSFRWTGSWLTVNTTPDPAGGQPITPDQRSALTDQLNRARMAGYESYVPDPQYVSIDVLVEVCAVPGAFAGDVQQSVRNALTAFFAPDNFTFGQGLERSAVERTVQNTPGVAGVLCTETRVRGRSQIFTEMPDSIAIAAGQILRCSNDPSAPERGSISVQVSGGA